MKTATDPRHLARQGAVQELFAWQANKKSKILSIKAKAVLDNLAVIDAIIERCAPEWKVEKINPIDLAILRLAVFELCLEVTQPPKVVIDEAVELAHEFGGESSPAFINGALGKALVCRERTLKVIAVKLGVDDKDLLPEANLTADLNATDLEIADLITVLEKDLHLKPPSDLTRFQTVGSILDYIDEQND